MQAYLQGSADTFSVARRSWTDDKTIVPCYRHQHTDSIYRVTEMVQNELLKNWRRTARLSKAKARCLALMIPSLVKHQVDLEFVTPTSEKAVGIDHHAGIDSRVTCLIRSKLQPYKRVYLRTFIKTANENNQVGKLLLDA